jgi:hypothetical protein
MPDAGLLGLIGVGLYRLVKDLPDRAARISRLAIPAFLVMYAARSGTQEVA